MGEPSGLRYRIEAYLPGGIRLETELWWDDARAVLGTAWDDAWATGEALKLARVLKRTGKATLVRWRGRDSA